MSCKKIYGLTETRNTNTRTLKFRGSYGNKENSRTKYVPTWFRSNESMRESDTEDVRETRNTNTKSFKFRRSYENKENSTGKYIPTWFRSNESKRESDTGDVRDGIPRPYVTAIHKKTSLQQKSVPPRLWLYRNMFQETNASEKTTGKDTDDDLGVDKNERRIVLIGKTGVGKSSTANTILGRNHFESKVSSKSVTKKCAKQEAFRFGKKILVVDTPGLFDTEMTNEMVTCEIVKCIAITSPGPHVFIIVVQVGRFTQEEKNTVDEFLKRFGKKVLDFAIVLFTKRDALEADDTELDEYVQDVPKSLREILQKCGNRYIAFNNNGATKSKENDVKSLFKLVEQIMKDNTGSCYTNEMYEVAEKEVQERMRRIKELERQKKNEEIRQIKEGVSNEYNRKINALNIERKREQNEQRALRTQMDQLKKDNDRTRRDLRSTEINRQRQMDERIQHVQRIEAEKEEQRQAYIQRLNQLWGEREAELRREKYQLEQKLLREREERYEREVKRDNLRRRARRECQEKKGFLSHAWDGICSFGSAILSPFKALFS